MNTASPYWLAAGWTMLHFLWLGFAVGGLALAVRRVIGRAEPGTRYGVSLALLLLLAAIPAGIYPLLARQFIEQSVQAEFAREALERAAAKVQTGVKIPLPPGVTLPSESETQPLSAGPLGQEASLLYLSRQTLGLVAAYAPWLWLIGSPAALVLLLTGLVGAANLRRTARPITEPALHRLVHRLAGELQIAGDVALAISDRVAAPILLGIARPMILLPPAVLAGLSPDQMEMILLHELAHVRRWDNLVNLLQRVIEALLFFHPVVWLVSNWVRLEREHCCDAQVLARTKEPQAYAETLASLAIPGLSPAHAAAALANHQLVTRIRHILNLEDRPMTISRGGLVLAAAISLAALVAIIVAAVPTTGTEGKTGKTARQRDAVKAAEGESFRRQASTDVPLAPTVGRVRLLENLSQAGSHTEVRIPAGTVLSEIDLEGATDLVVGLNKRGYGPEQAVGPPDAKMGSDDSRAWCPAQQDASEDESGEWLELTYAKEVEPAAVLVYESYASGGIREIVVKTASGDHPYPVAQGESKIGAVTVIPLAASPPTRTIRLKLNIKETPGWQEIDAVGLLDKQGTVHWASDAIASSTYADRQPANLGVAVDESESLLGLAVHANQRARAPYSAAQATGPPDAKAGTDDPNAWSPASDVSGVYGLSLSYDEPVEAAALILKQTLYEVPVKQIQLVPVAEAGKLAPLIELGRPEQNAATLVMTIRTLAKISEVRILFEAGEKKVTQVDAVGLLDVHSGDVRWADKAVASSERKEAAAEKQDRVVKRGISWLARANNLLGENATGKQNWNSKIQSDRQSQADREIDLIRAHLKSTGDHTCSRCHQDPHVLPQPLSKEEAAHADWRDPLNLIRIHRAGADSSLCKNCHQESVKHPAEGKLNWKSEKADTSPQDSPARLAAQIARLSREEADALREYEILQQEFQEARATERRCERLLDRAKIFAKSGSERELQELQQAELELEAAKICREKAEALAREAQDRCEQVTARLHDLQEK